MRKKLAELRNQLQEARIWAVSVLYPRRVGHFYIPKNELDIGYSLSNTARAVKTAADLGWSTTLEVDAEGALVCKHQKRPPANPFAL
jgi:hypothetical protein